MCLSLAQVARILVVSVSVYPGKDPVDPLRVDMEPAGGTHRLAAKAEDEFAEGIFLKGQPHVHKVYVVIPPVICVADGGPNGDGVRVKGQIGLAQRGYIPQVGIAFGIDTGATADGVGLIAGEEESGAVGLHQSLEKAVVGDIVAGLQPVMAAQQVDEGLKVGFGGYFCRGHALGFRPTALPVPCYGVNYGCSSNGQGSSHVGGTTCSQTF